MYEETPRPKRSERGKVSKPRRHSAPRDISSLGPATASDETIRQTNKRRTRSDQVVSPAATKRRRKRLMITIAAVAGVLLIGGAVAAFAWVGSIGTKINAIVNSDPQLAQSLKSNAAPPGDPFYMVLMGSDTRPGETQARSDTLIVARVDPKNKKISLMSIPRDSRVDIPGNGTTKINAAATYGGPKLTIETVKQLTGLPISHYLNINFGGFRQIVDAIGGVWINVPQDIYDRQASNYGSAFASIKKGYQKLDGRLALTFVRARHALVDGDFGRMHNQQTFLKALASQALSLQNVFSATSIVNAIASNLDTDMSPAQLADLAIQFKGMKSSDIDSANAPGAAKYINGISYVVLDQVKLAEMIGRMKQGLPLDPTKTAGAPAGSTAATVTPTGFALTIRNGAGVSGLAKQASDFLTSKTFKVSSTGNTAQPVYNRTLVIYQNGYEAQANLTRETLGFGDVIASNGMYSFKTQVMVIVGKDWKDPATQPVGQ